MEIETGNTARDRIQNIPENISSYRLFYFICIFYYLLIFPLIVFSEPIPSLSFEHLCSDQGLSQNTINWILQDRKGFMWFGTEDGLNRFDGYDFVIYIHDFQDPGSISNNFVLSLCEDSQGNMWIGTEGGGLNLFDRENDRFIRYQSDVNDSNSLSDNSVANIIEDREGYLWIGTSNGGLNRFDKSTQQFIQYRHNEKDRNSLSHDFVRSLAEDEKGNLWVGTYGGGLDYFDKDSKVFTHYQHDPNDPESLSNNLIRSIYLDSESNLWIGTYGGGVNCLCTKTRSFRHFFYDPDDKNSLSYNLVTCVYEDSKKNIWVTTDRGGLNLYNKADQNFIRYQSDPNNPKSLSNNQIYFIYEDNQNEIWIGNFSDGIDMYSPIQKKFAHYLHNPKNIKSLSHNSVLSAYEDSRHNIWIGTDDGGLNLFNRNAGTFINYQRSERPYSISSNAVLSMCEDHDGNFWIGTYAGGLNLFDRDHKRFHAFKHNETDSTSLKDNNVWTVFEDSQNNLWIGTELGGLNRMIKPDNTFEYYMHNKNDPNSLCNDNVRVIFEDSNHELWIGTFGGGIDRFDRENKNFAHYTYHANDSTSLSCNQIVDMFEDSKKRLWIGTWGGGLNLFDRKRGVFKAYRTKDGLPNDVICGILEDDKGNLWISTNKGLSKFNPETESFRNYGVCDGLQGDQFHRRSCLLTHQGEMIFGGVQGFNIFCPDSVRDDTYLPPILITDFQIFNKPVRIGIKNSPLKKHITETDTLILSYKHSVFSFKFAALDYSDYGMPDKKQYAYQLQGFDKEWNYVGTKRTATYTNIDPGHYVFKIKASNSDGMWNEEGVALKIVITPPFWQTGLFRFFCGILIVASILGVHNLRVRSINNQRKRLEVQVRERTVDLKKTNELLKKEIKEHKMTESKLEQSNKELAQFAYVASHDLQEPLRMISSYLTILDQRYREKLDKDAIDFIEFAVNGAKRMQALITDLLDYSRITNREKPFEHVNLEEVVDRVKVNLKMAIEEKQAQLTQDPLPSVKGDAMQLERLFQNLISNAIKYCDQRSPLIRITVLEKDMEYILGVHDNGIGINQKHFENIFKIFHRLHGRGEYSGTGIGLAVCKKIVEKHGGKIWLESEEGEGSHFFFTLPVIT